ncbi:MAG: hypothetical protein C0173_07095 [Desulfurella sp.]|uniref:hypothetical protein n=1 Tax=Desulfurella sp. TaxID=1962857 RepID=UPI00046D2BA2|nr:hypothetical protein [Desulfurella sp.]PMP88498.1 MAG: hypothetical protein C0173_07095 [Desulfurella sp.]HEX13968.1 hypothetical protein [Desulfurella acetivorans]
MEIKIVKIVTGETVIGTKVSDYLEDVALIQVIPSSGGIQLAILPYGFPFEDKIGGKIPLDKIVYEFKDVPDDIKNKYLEAKSDIKISSTMPGSNLDFNLIK